MTGLSGPKVLVGSPVRQRPTILEACLRSLAALRRSGLRLDFAFVDDNDLTPEGRAASALLQSFRHPDGDVWIQRAAPAREPYVCDDETHRWREALIWRVAQHKDWLIRRACESGYDFLFLVDSDLVLHPYTLLHLLSLARDIVSEVFWTRWQPLGQELPQVWVRDQYTLFEARRDEPLTDTMVQARQADFLVRLKQPGVYRVGGLGACTLISRRALSRGVSFQEIYNLSFWGEDRHFCIRAAALGLEMFVDTHYPAYHLYRESDLQGLPAYLERTALEATIFDTVKGGLEALASCDYRVTDGREGWDYLAPALRQRLEDARASFVTRAYDDRSVLTAQTSGLQLLKVSPDQRCAVVRCRLTCTGTKRQVPVREAYTCTVEVADIAGRWLLRKIDLVPEEEAVPTPVGTGPASSTWRRVVKTGGNRLTLAMLVRNEAGRYLRQVLEHARRYVDEAVIVDDASEDDTVAICSQALRGIPLTLVSNPVPAFHDEIRLRRQLWELTLRTNPDWILVLDADEMFEDRAVHEIRALLEDPWVDVYCFRLYDFWDSEHYREDTYWQAHKVYRPFLLRYQPDFPYRWKETPLHCGRLPVNVLELPSRNSPLRIKHLGWSSPRDRAEKYRRYKTLDPHGQYGILAQYESILDPHPTLVRWEE